jgi:hypothetical protein
MTDWKELVKADQLGSYLEWDADGLHCVIRYGYNDVVRVFCYGKKAPFEMMSYRDYNFLLPREFGQLRTGFNLFRAMGVLKSDATEESFRLCPENTILDDVIFYLMSQFGKTQNRFVMDSIIDFLNYMDARKYAVTSLCLQTKDIPEIEIVPQKLFIDAIHLKRYIFAVWDTEEVARASWGDIGVTHDLEVDSDRVDYYVNAGAWAKLGERLYYTTLIFYLLIKVEIKSLIPPVLFWKTSDSYEYAAQNGLDNPYEPFQCWYDKYCCLKGE